MFTDPKIVLTEDLNVRGYITYYFDGKRIREYNAKKLNADINPNFAKTYSDKKRLLAKLQFEFKKALNSGWSPLQVDLNKSVSLKEAMNNVLNEKLSSGYSKTYKRDLNKVFDQFTSFIPKSILNQFVDNVDPSYIEDFLCQFKSSNRHYMNKRRSLSVFFSEMVKRGYANKNIVLNTSSLKAKSVLHTPYKKEELKSVLEFLSVDFPNLHLCCMLTYGCLLRPHQEIRLLKRKHINDNFSEIHLSGSENKSGRIRTVYIPGYISEILRVRLEACDNMEFNIFTLDECAFNEDYFKTQWSRAKVEMLKSGLIRKGQTLYSFRHTAAINVYRKTKDLHILQQLLQHSNMIVTLNYLRGLGEVNDERLRDVLPEL